MNAMVYTNITHIILYTAMTGCVLHIVIPETSHDVVMGILFLLLALFVAVSLAWTLFLVQELGFITFYIFGTVACITAYFYVSRFVRETFGLSDHEKKNIYTVSQC